jgi:hypothetical protein
VLDQGFIKNLPGRLAVSAATAAAVPDKRAETNALRVISFRQRTLLQIRRSVHKRQRQRYPAKLDQIAE